MKLLPTPAGPCDQHVELVFDPGERGEHRDQLWIDTAWCARIEILERRVLRQLRPAQSLCEAFGVALGDLVLDHHAQALFEA